MAVRAPVALSLLVVGDEPSSVETALERATDSPVDPTVEAVHDVTAAHDFLVGTQPDCVVATATAEEDAAAVVADLNGDWPIVAVVEDEPTAREAMAAGATEYVLAGVIEDRPELLRARVRGAVDEAFEVGTPGSTGWYEALLADSMDALTVIAADATIRYQNPSVERLLGYEPRALVGTDSLSYVHPEDRERVRETFQELYEAGDGASGDLEFRFQHADGSWEWLESRVTTRLDPGIRGYVVNSRLITERKERATEVERYETLLSVIPDTIAITDLEGNHVDIYGFEGWSGYEREELVGEHISITTPEADIERAREVVTDLILDDDREKATYETTIVTKDGEPIPFENHVTPLPPDEDGDIPGTMNVLRNIEDRKERERRLQQAETVFQNVRDGVFLVDVTDEDRHVFQRANEAYEEIMGFAEPEIRGKTPGEVIPDPDVAAEIESEIASVVETGSVHHEERRLDVPGMPTHVETWLAPVIAEGEVVNVVGVLRDISERKRRQRELELKNQAMDEAPIGITIAEDADDDLSLIYVNEGFEELTGYGEAEVLGESWSIIVGEETDPETLETLERAYENAETASEEVLIYRRDGVPRWSQSTLSPIRNAEGEVTHYVGFQQDITDLKEYETEIERRFDEFAEVFAEDLREPLEAAAEALETARQNGDEAALEEAADWIERADSLRGDLATVHSFAVPSRDRSESALLGPRAGE